MPAPLPASPPSAIEAAVLGSRALLQRGDYKGALRQAEQLLIEVPENRDVLYLVAVSLRYLGRTTEALAALARLEAIHPAHSRLFQERGHCQRLLGDTAAALAAYRRAVELNPALPASWQGLAELAEPAAAAQATRVAAQLAAMPQAVVAASSLVADGEVADGERLIRQFLQQQPGNLEAVRVLAQAAMRQRAFEQAQPLLERVLAAAPEHYAARYEYALVLAQRHRHADALREAQRLLAADPGHAAFLTVKANALAALGENTQALALFRELLERSPGSGEVALCVAHALKTLGRQSEAIAAYQAAAGLPPHRGEAYWGLANLKTYRFSDAQIEAMQAALAALQCPPAERYHLSFALGKALEDRGEFAASFAHYVRGNDLKRLETGYLPEAVERTAALQMRICTPEFFAARAGFGCPQPGPVFIVGLPRAGSTLLEQILASHSQIQGTWELPEVPRLAAALGAAEHSPGYPQVLASLDAARCGELGEQYLADTAAYRGGRAVFIDKMPNNFRHIGLIHLILPNAKIIDARREPIACCFSAYRQLFAAGQEFTYDLRDLGRYYRSYAALMAHWDQVLPGKVLHVEHESVVADLEGSVRRMLAFLGLPFEPGCLQFHRTERAVRTASSEQVRQPLSGQGLDHWRHFEPWLAPLRETLEGCTP